MDNKIENLMLEHLKKFQLTLDRIERDIGEIKTRLNHLENGQASLIIHIGHLSAAIATQQISIDGTNDRINRIERRLEIA